MAFERAVVDVLTLHPDIACLQFFGGHGKFDAGPETLVLVDDQAPQERISPASFTAASSSGRRAAWVGIFSEKTRVTPVSASE